MVLISIVLVIATVMPFILGACSGFKITLSQPSLSYDNGIVSWKEIGFTGGYEVTVYEDVDGQRGEALGASVTQQTTNYALTSDGIFWVGVKALSSKSLFKDSDEAFIRVEKKNTEEDVTVPGDGDEDGDEDNTGGDGDTEDPSDPDEDILPSGAPALDLPVGAKQRFNYMSVASLSGVTVALTQNTGKVTELYASGIKLTSDWSYNEETNSIKLSYSMFSGVSTGCDTAFTAYTEDGNSFDFYVTVCSIDKVPTEIDLPSYGAYVFCKNSSAASDGVSIGFESATSTQAVSVDGLRIANSTANYVSTSTGIKFKENYLKNLVYGLHRVELFTTKGIIDFYIFVYSSSIMCYDLAYEFDESYPGVTLTWSVDYPIDKYEVIVNGTVYSSEKYPAKFDGNSFDLTGIVSEGGSYSACIKSYVNGLDTPATSATVSYADNRTEIGDYLDPSKGFTYLDKTYNRYIDSDEEMNVLAFYMILYNSKLKTASFNTTSGSKTMTYMDIYPDPSLGLGNASAVMSAFAEACGNYKESIKYTYAAVKLADGGYRIGISMTSKNEALYDSTTSYTESANNKFHLYGSDRSEDFDDFAINEREGVSVETSDQLFFAVEAGLRPVPVAGSVAERLYELAKDVCRNYIDDDMTDYEKVHTIYDWLGKNVVYDYNIVQEMAGISPGSSRYDKFYSYDSFYLEGVLENGVAVCNGIAKTFVLLCGIEGITAVKVNGQANGGAHAWNKVLINEKWYIVDSTWSNQKSTGNKEAFTHDYLFITTSESASDRTEQTEDTIGYYCGDRQISVNY